MFAAKSLKPFVSLLFSMLLGVDFENLSLCLRKILTLANRALHSLGDRTTNCERYSILGIKTMLNMYFNCLSVRGLYFSFKINSAISFWICCFMKVLLYFAEIQTPKYLVDSDGFFVGKEIGRFRKLLYIVMFTSVASVVKIKDLS